jgi:hypothetical protein
MVREQNQKVCRACGTDVTHRFRHKDRQGEYLCGECLDAKKRPSRRQFLGLTGQKLPRGAVVAVLAAAAAWVFWKLLVAMNQP